MKPYKQTSHDMEFFSKHEFWNSIRGGIERYLIKSLHKTLSAVRDNLRVPGDPLNERKPIGTWSELIQHKTSTTRTILRYCKTLKFHEHLIFAKIREGVPS